jgi:hypothetical protein
MDWFMEQEIEYKGFTAEEINAIEEHFLCRLDLNDWESIEFVNDGEEEEYDNLFKLPTGRMVYFPDELIRKEELAQMD